MYEELLGMVQQEYNAGNDSSDTDVTTERKKWDKREIADSSSDDDDEIGRNPDASPVKFQGKKINDKYLPKMSEVVEETEPESSFKETERKKRLNK